MRARTKRSPRFLASLALSACCACGSAASTSHVVEVTDSGAAACTTVKSPPVVHLPHVEASGAKAQAVAQAIGAILASQSPPVDPNASSYTLSNVDCGDVASPDPGGGGYGCSLSLSPAGGKSTTITTPSNSPSAKSLYDALSAAGAGPCTDYAHGTSRLENLAATSTMLSFDDVSNDQAPPTPNLSVKGTDAQGILDALAGAKIQDCDETRDLFLECTSFPGMTGSPTCGYQWEPLERIGDSELANACNPVEVTRRAASWPRAPRR